MEILLSWRGWDWRWETESLANSLAMESQWETNQSSGLWRGNTQWSWFNWRSPPVPTASPTTPPRLSWLGFLDDSEYFRLIMIGQTPGQCPGKLSDDQTQGPVLDHSTLMSLKISVSWVRMSRVFRVWMLGWKPEFIRETVWCPCQLSGHQWCCHVYVCDHWLRSPGVIVSAIDWSLVITASLPLTGPSSCQQTDTPSIYSLAGLLYFKKLSTDLQSTAWTTGTWVSE